MTATTIKVGSVEAALLDNRIVVHVSRDRNPQLTTCSPSKLDTKRALSFCCLWREREAGGAIAPTTDRLCFDRARRADQSNSVLS